MVRCIQTGAVCAKRGERGFRRYLLDDWSDRALPVNCFLLERADGLVLFDTGQTAAAASSSYFPRWHPYLRLARFELGAGDEVAAQVRALGHDTAEVRMVVLSHLHTDHTGGLAPFARAEVIVSRVEWQRATGLTGRLRGYLPQRWPPGLHPRLADFDGPAIGPFPASSDLAGDGQLILVPTSGHTPGHAALLARDGERRYLFAGDIAHTAAEVAPDLAAWARNECVTVLTAHDGKAAHLIRVPPWEPSPGSNEL